MDPEQGNKEIASAVKQTAELELVLVDARTLFELPRNDHGNAQRLRARYGRDLIWVDGFGWFIWDERRWAHSPGHRDGHGPKALELAHRTATAILDEAAAHGLEAPMPPDDWDKSAEAQIRRERYKAHTRLTEQHRRFGIASGNIGRSSAMLASAVPYLSVSADRLNRDPHLVNCLNGTLRITNVGVQLHPHSRDDLITMLAPVEYDPTADCPRFEAFLREILPDQEVRAFVLSWLGYCLLGLTNEQIVTFFIGRGANGKSTLLELIADLFGDYAATVPIATFLHDSKKHGGEATPDLARLPGRRFVQANEPERGDRFSESTVKSITGLSRVSVRALYGSPFEYVPIFKITISANSYPVIRGADDGIWRRIRVVPFDYTIPKEKRDSGIKTRLIREEGKGIFRRIVDAAVRYCEIGHLAPASAVQNATESYRTESDPLGQWLDSCVIQSDEWTPAVLLYKNYCGWCRANAHTPLTDTLFGRLLRERGISKRVPKLTEYRLTIVVKDFEDQDGSDDESTPEVESHAY